MLVLKLKLGFVHRDLGGGVLELRHGSAAQHAERWLVVTRSFNPTVARLDVDVPETEV